MRKGQPQKTSLGKPQMSPSRTRSPKSLASASSRSSSPLNTEGTPPPHLITGQRYQGDVGQESDADGSPGIRYITEPLIKKLAKQENLARITALNLSLGKDGGKKFKYIENLEKCSKLEVLNLSHNLIEKIEKLDKLLKLLDLNLSFNKISKIEGIEHLHNLQKLNLAGNEIEHLPMWLGKKLRSLRILNLRKNKISSLHEVAKLKPLKDLTSLFLADNPVVNLPHYRLYTIFHLRSLEDLEGQPVTNGDREEALERFNLEEVEHLENNLEQMTKEMERLKNEQSHLLGQLQQQEEQNKSLKQKHGQQKQSHKDLESELETKNELLKQKTVELTRACQKQYELEQELAFYKIDAKFEPLGYYPVEDVEFDNVPGESPYIGKARYKRNMYAVEGYIPSKAQQMQVGNLEQEEQQEAQQLKQNLLQLLDEQLEEKERKIKGAQEKLAALHSEVAKAEQHVLKVTEELKQVQDAVAQKKVSEAEKDCFRQQLSSKILLLNQLQEEALELERQMQRQRQEMVEKEKELEGLQDFLDSLDPKDPRHAHMKAQKASQEQQLDIMRRHYKQLESRLDDMLSRIANETEEIRDLEQQLTDGQIAANEALKKDLEEVIIGLQEYLENVKSQTKQATDECKELRKDKEGLQKRVEELEEERNQLEIVAIDAENLRRETANLERALQEQRELNEALQEAQGEISAYEAELEAELKARDAEASQQKEELEKLKQIIQVEHSALQAQRGKERQALENALAKAQLSEERELENNKLLSQLKQLQKDNNLLRQQLKDTQEQLNHTVDSLIHPEEVSARVSELKQKLQTGAEIRCHNSKDILGKSLADLQKQFAELLAHSQQEKQSAQARERELQKELATQQAKLEEAQGKYKLACNRAAEAKIKSERRQNEARVQQLESEIQHLVEKLKSMEEIQGLTDQQLQEADEEKERILAQLEDLENKKKAEDARAQLQFQGLNEELKALKQVISASDKQATAQLCAAKDQLQSLHGTVCKINQERTEELQEAEKFCMQATQAAKDLARAETEIELLQKLLKEKEAQLELEKNNAEIATSHLQKEEMDKLNDLLKWQKAETDRLRSALDQAKKGNRAEIESILGEIDRLRRAISQQNDTIASIVAPFQQNQHLFFVPSSSQASTPASQSTKDSGVILQCPMSTPVIKQDRRLTESKKEHHPVSRECYVHSSVQTGLQEPPSSRHRGEGEAQLPSASPYVLPPGSIIYTLLPDGTPVPQGTVLYGPPPPSVQASGGPLAPTTVIYGSPPAGVQLHYAPLPANCSVPFVPLGILHCNIPDHRNLENDILRLEDSIETLKSQRHKDGSPRACPREHNKEMEELNQGIQDLLREREELEDQVAELRRIAQKRNQRKDFIEGRGGNLTAELELEKSIQCHENIMDEIECIEKTLLKRRAELREADSLLAEAEHELENTRGKTKDTIQKYNSAKQHLSRTEKEAEELERRTQEMAVRLVKADQQFRLLQADAQDLEQHKMEQEGILKEINQIVSAKDSEFQILSQKIEILTESLQKLQRDIQVAEGNEDNHLQILKEAENILLSKKHDLERLKDQTAVQQQELHILDRLLDQKRNELRLLQDSIAEKNTDFAEALANGEAEVAEKQQLIKEMKTFLEDLSVQKGELNAQLSEKRSQLSLIMQNIRKEEKKLQDILGLIKKHKTELKQLLETAHLEKEELEGLKFQHSQKTNELEKTEMLVLEEKLELENLQQASQRHRGEAEHQRQLLREAQQEVERLTSQLHLLRNRIKALNDEKRQLEANCESLEEKFTQTKRTLASTEDNNKAILASTEKLILDIQKLQLEIDQLHKQKIALNQDTAELQKHFHGKKEELNGLKTELNDSRHHLQLLEQDVKDTAKEKGELLQEQKALKDAIHESSRKCKEAQEAQREKENQLHKLRRELEEQELKQAKQEKVLQHLREDVQREEKKFAECTEKLKNQKQQLEQELAEQQGQLAQAVANVQEMEERIRKLQKGESHISALEETLHKTWHQLSEKEQKLQEKMGEVSSLQRELDLSKAEERLLQDRIQADRLKVEKQIATLKETIKTQRDQLESALQEQKQENYSLQREIALLGQVAQENHQRAKRLMRDLGQIQEEHMQLKSQMKNQEALEKRQKELKGTVKLIRLEVKDKMRNGLKDLSQSPPELLESREAELEAKARPWGDVEGLKENYPFTENKTRMLSLDEKLDLSKVHITDEQWRGKAQRERLQHHEDRLKAQLRQCMSKQAEVLIKGKQQTEGTLHSLKRQVDALGELVSSTSTDSLFPSLNSSGFTDSVHEESDLAKNQSARSPSSWTTDISAQSQVIYQYKA
ncbi:centriolin isoform X1 [Python bivittatus]|uniref:Centriolin isoform X1 n=3 Tax=Python bivittatus TaxID=176946 RepID=A0A9F3W2G4_PYTBI|nr:centriolin isoform X1 [Python bivittatus]XP_025028071.1 centriolin isoform X1 [Python bivittatus]